MGSEEMFSGTISTLAKALDLRSIKHNLLVSNVANKDTPNYKSFDLNVEEEMQKLKRDVNKASLTKTDPGHLPAMRSEDYTEIEISSSKKGFEKPGDGNSVDIEKEMTSLAENSLLYDAMAQIIRKKLQGLKVVIQGGSK